MDALYYVSCLVGICWLVVWLIRMENNGQRTPSPFEMRDIGSVPKVDRFRRKKRV